ncbi:MAG: hypothetical protein ACRDK5_02570, partial [Solirubrobacterales bacterium]
VDQFGAPRYPELVLVASSGGDQLAHRVLGSLTRSYEILGKNPDRALQDLVAEVPGLDRSSQTAQLDALTSSQAFTLGDSAATSELEHDSVARWHRWAQGSGLLQGP